MVYDKGKVITGLVVFLIILLSPLWYNALSGKVEPSLKLSMPKEEKSCIEERMFMRSNHMDLLIKWRDDAVRKGIRTYKGLDGKVYRISLTGTCLSCHIDKAGFCDRCHGYSGVKTPKCWDCHNIPKEEGSKV
ncbi:MAG: sulfate reduction electron transfer complex DsrMKJOP subunit DsrJ [Syntrophorhabdaceae bacterium]|nr:sulfate reduction electron transfer complex DsrMKJOP subunit DsrJ [Syntrophorhabdaceae bacterium]